MGNKNNNNNNQATIKESVVIKTDKSSISVPVEGSIDLHVTGTADELSVKANDSSCEASIKGNTITVKGAIVGNSSITIYGKGVGKLDGNIVIPVTVSGKVKEPTRLVATPSENITIVKDQPFEIAIDTNALDFRASVLNNNNNLQLQKADSKRSLTVTGTAITAGTIVLSATAADSLETVVKINVQVITSEALNPVTTTEKAEIPTVSSASTYLQKFSSFENTVGLTLTRMVQVECWDLIGYGRFKRNYILKNLISEMNSNSSARKVGSVKFVNEEYAKSAIRLIIDLTPGEYGQRITDIQKERLVKKVVTGNNIKL